MGLGSVGAFAPLGGSKELNTPLASCGLILKRGYNLHNNERDEPNPIGSSRETRPHASTDNHAYFKKRVQPP